MFADPSCRPSSTKGDKRPIPRRRKVVGPRLDWHPDSGLSDTKRHCNANQIVSRHTKPHALATDLSPLPSATPLGHRPPRPSAAPVPRPSHSRCTAAFPGEPATRQPASVVARAPLLVGQSDFATPRVVISSNTSAYLAINTKDNAAFPRWLRRRGKDRCAQYVTAALVQHLGPRWPPLGRFDTRLKRWQERALSARQPHARPTGWRSLS
jgi:hypothetical protein